MRIARILPALLVAAALALPALAEGLININTADVATLDTLPGIGPAKAQAIIDYREQNGPFASIEDIQNVSGIGPATYADIAPLITVGETADANAGSESRASGSYAEPAPTASTGPSAKPAALALGIGGDRSATLHTPILFTADVRAGGSPYMRATVAWSFGDGSAAVGYAAQAVYDRPGAYLVSASARDGEAAAESNVRVTVLPAQVRIKALERDGIVLANDGSGPLDLSGWMLVEGPKNFRIPPGTRLAGGTEVFFPARATGLSYASAAVLAYPDGTLATSYPPAAAAAPPRPAPVAAGLMQRDPSAAGSPHMQTVEPALTSPNVENHADAPAADRPIGAVAGAPGAGGLLRSGWLYGILGILALAGGALLIL